MWMAKSAMLLCVFCVSTGCNSLSNDCAGNEYAKSSKKLLAWQLQSKDGKEKKDEKSEDGKKEDDDKSPKDIDKKDGSDEQAQSEITTDRPDFTESSTTVGKGHIQLESGYTLSRNRNVDVRNGHSFPEALLRIGLFADWFEVRIGQNYSSTNISVTSTDGLEDLYLGVKLALTEQKKFLPETALVIQATVPTGPDKLTAGKTLPGINFLFGWDVVPDKLTMGGSIQGNAAITDDGKSYLELAQSFTVGYSFTDKFGCYMEVFGKEPFSSNASDVGPEFYYDGGFTYKFTPNFQYDIRAGIGLNRNSDDFFVGTGFAVRY